MTPNFDHFFKLVSGLSGDRELFFLILHIKNYPKHHYILLIRVVTYPKKLRAARYWRELSNTEQDLETLYQNDCTDSSDSDCRQIHAVIKQVTENDVENRNFQYLATSGYFVHDFEELNIEKNLR